eukprot:scaffold35168_cov31-Tisochrysis_lutea.AAC.1
MLYALRAQGLRGECQLSAAMYARRRATLHVRLETSASAPGHVPWDHHRRLSRPSPPSISRVPTAPASCLVSHAWTGAW